MMRLEDYEERQKGDVLRRNENERLGRKLCERCEGTGNQLFWMYQKCEKCGGLGYLEGPSEEKQQMPAG